ncbi:MAG: riboflavin biosynthesis protein RibF [Flavobacteriales bacterium]|nr:riboflavin biosynthesis protein RibF [Flavobacteriales bacterium]
MATGTFDGLHIGHAKIFEQLFITGRSLGLPTAILTFSPHPRRVLGRGPVPLLTTDSEKAVLLAKHPFAPDYLIFQPFTKEIASLSARKFIREILMEKWGMQALVAGYDHHLGNDRDAGPAGIEEMAAQIGFSFVCVEAQRVGSRIHSSSAIRQLLIDGAIEQANHVLGYPYFISGRVVKGNNIGNALGFPTANVAVPEDKILPAHGVYAVMVETSDGWKKGMLNIGLRPTLGVDMHTVVEVHIFDFSGDLYEKEIEIQLHRSVRDEIKFESLEALRLQLKKDRIACENLLSLL